MKHDKRVFELASQMSIPFDLLQVCVLLILICKLRNVMQLTSDFSTGCYWMLKCMHVMWYVLLMNY